MDDLYNEIFDACNKTFGQEVSFHLKKELAESIAVIFQNYFDEISNQTSNLNSNINIFITPNFPMFSTPPNMNSNMVNMNSNMPNMNSIYFPNPYYIPMLPFQSQITPLLPQNVFTPIQPMNMFNMPPFYNQPRQKQKKKHKAKILSESSKAKSTTKPPIPSEQEFSNQNNPDQNNPDQTDTLASRPPNAFILYSQAMRSEVRQQNPDLSGTEISRILGRMWRDLPEETKNQYKERAQRAQEEFKRNHPDYTYRKARRKAALNELLQRSTQRFGQTMSFNTKQRSQNEPETE